ncbi:uncharacterized protein LOC125515512 isoform X1 [Triticum urartu]|uniref:uncharacterized protein LOC125515512 isoform X1 n=1 Tax=Triticum urartu TaxID=4572 RepID=UPI0020437934|nr:uncharacterized protein LOC125515512 isoform X1 [Triticum urartu]
MLPLSPWTPFPPSPPPHVMDPSFPLLLHGHAASLAETRYGCREPPPAPYPHARSCSRDASERERGDQGSLVRDDEMHLSENEGIEDVWFAMTSGQGFAGATICPELICCDALEVRSLDLRDSSSWSRRLQLLQGAASSRSTTIPSLPPTLAIRPSWRRPDPRWDRTCLCS